MKTIIRYFLLISFLGFSFGIGVFLYLVNHEWVDFSVLQNYSSGKPSVILDDKGEIFAKFQLDKREPVTFDKLPNILVKAFIAAEDWNFFDHSGICWKGIIRSLVVNLLHGRIVQGASTITQQLIRFFFVSREKTFLRKLCEIFLAFQVEQNFTKEQILEHYLNNIYFGRGVYGVEAASQRFWNKPVSDITIAQAATLAAIAKSAFLFSPLNAPLNSQRRRNIILFNMHKLNFISFNDYKKAKESELELKDNVFGDPSILYIQEWIRIWAEKKWGRQSLYKDGLKIKTTISIENQNIATKIFKEKIDDARKKTSKKLNGAMLSINTRTGGIKVLIGGYDFYESQYNRAIQASRQIGSAFKPFLYTAALKSGFDMDDIFVDEPIEMDMFDGSTWKPRNSTNRFDGDMTLIKALTLSNNIVAIKLFLSLGMDFVIEWAKKFGLKKQLNSYPSLALGTAEASARELAASFNVFANEGRYIEPYLVEWVKDKWGNKLWEHEKKQWDVLDIKTNSKMINALSYRIKRAKRLLKYRYWINAQAIGKTGSTNEASTTWFVGSIPELTTCVYIGRDDNKPLGRNVFASGIVFPIWLDFNIKQKCKKKNFYIDPNLKEVAINWNNGRETTKLDKESTVFVLK